MNTPSEEPKDRLWRIIVAYGLEEEFERDWLGRIKSRRSRRYLKAEITPELAGLLAEAKTQAGGAVGVAKAALVSAPDRVRGLLSSLQEAKPAD